MLPLFVSGLVASREIGQPTAYAERMNEVSACELLESWCQVRRLRTDEVQPLPWPGSASLVGGSLEQVVVSVSWGGKGSIRLSVTYAYIPSDALTIPCRLQLLNNCPK